MPGLPVPPSTGTISGLPLAFMTSLRWFPFFLIFAVNEWWTPLFEDMLDRRRSLSPPSSPERTLAFPIEPCELEYLPEKTTGDSEK